MNEAGRPLSPHLTIYRWPITMTLSILHRITGVALSTGLVILTVSLLALSRGAAAYEPIAALLDSIIGSIAGGSIAGWSIAATMQPTNASMRSTTPSSFTGATRS